MQKNTESYEKEGFSKKADVTGYEVIIDTNENFYGWRRLV
jgi:hypothetical protein